MTCTLANPSALGSAQASFAIRCVPSITIGAGSTVTVTLPSQMTTIASSSVTGGNGLASSTTTNPSTGNYRLSGAFLTDRPVSVNYIEVLLNNMINPIGMGSYTLTMAIQSAGGCTYSSGTATLVVDKIPSITSVALRLSNSNRNLYETYTFAVTPSASTLNSGDYLVLTLPSTPQQVLLSQLGVVVSIVSNANLVSLSSQVVGPSKVRLDFSTSAAGYAANKTLEFSMKYLRNPDFVGDVAGFVFQLFTSSNLQYENFTNLIQTYTNFITATSTSTSFSNSYVGLTDSVTYNLQLDTQLLLGTKIMLTLSDKFEVSPASTQLLTSSIPATLQATAGTTNQIVFTLTSDVAPDTNMTFTLRARNPLRPVVTSPDVLANVTTADGKQVSAPVLFTRQVFSCDVFCADCIGMFSNCTACVSGYYLSSARCVLQTEVSQAIPPFVFAGIGVALFLLLLLLGGGCDVRNYWCNMLYPLFKLDMFAFLIYFAYSWSSNIVNVSWFRYVGYAALLMHFVLGWWFLFLIKSDAKVVAASFENVEQNGHRYPLTKAEEEIGSSEESLEQEFNGSVKFTYFTAFLISVAMPRWLFSARGKSKGFFWYLAENDFSQLKHHLNIYQFLYFLFVLIPITAMSAYQLYQTWGANGWKNYLVEMGLMTLLDVFYFILAFCELLSPPKKSGKKIFSKNDKYAVAKDINAADSSAILQGGPLLDNTIRDDEASPKKVKQTLQIEPQQTSIIVGAASVKPTNLEITRPTVFEIRTDKRPSVMNSAPQKLDQVRLQRLVEYDPKSSRLASPNNNLLRESKLNSFVFSPAAGNKTPRTVLSNSQLRDQKLNMAGTSTIVIAGKTPKKQSNYSSINKDIFVPLPLESDSVMGVTEANSLTHSGTNVLAKKKPVLGVRVEDLRPKQPAAEFKLAPHPISGIMRPQPIEYGVISEKEDLKIPQKKNSLRSPYGNSGGYFDDEEDGQLSQRQGMELSVEDDEEVFKYISRREDYSNPSHIKVPKKSRFLENQLFSKWGFARSDPKRYYEIIYEEDDKDKVSLKENPLYDPYPKRAQQKPKSPENSMRSVQKGQISDSAMVAIDRKPPRVVLEPQRMPARVAPAELESTIETTSPREWKPLPLASPPVKKIINGQLESDLQRGILRDRNKKVLDLNNQPDLNPFESGRFTTEDPRVEFELPSQPPRQFSKGIMKDSEGRVFRIADQDFELLAQGITLGRDGKPDNFNGQRPEEVQKGIIRDRDGEYLNLNKIKPDDYRKGTFVTEASRKVEIGAEQDPEKIKVGLVTAPDGNDYRMKDQKFEEIQKAGVFRDRNLIPLLLKKLPDTIYEEESELEDDYEIPEKPPAALSQIKVTDSSIRNTDGVPKRPETIPRIAIDTAFKQKPVPGPSVMEKKEEGAYYVSPRHTQKHNPSNDDGTSGREDAKKPPKVILKKNPTGPKPAFIKAEDTKMPNKNVELENPNSRSMNESSRQQDPNMETNGHSRPESGKKSHKMDSQKNLESKTPRVITSIHEPKKTDPRDSSPRVEVLSPGRQARVEEPTMKPVNSQPSAIKKAENPAPYEQARISPEKPKQPMPESRDRYQRVMTPTDPPLEDYIVGDPQQQSDPRVSKPSTGKLSEKQTPQKPRDPDEERYPINDRTGDQKVNNNTGKIKPIMQEQKSPEEKLLDQRHHIRPEDEEDDGKKQSTKNLSATKPLSNRPPVPVSYAKAENPAQVEQQVPGKPPQNPTVTTKEGPKPLKRLSLKKKDSSRDASREDNTVEMKPSVKSKNLEIDEIQSDKSKAKDWKDSAKDARRVSEDDREDLDNRQVLVDDHDDGRANKHDESDELPVRQSPKSQARQDNPQNGDNVRPIGQQNNLKGIMNPDRDANRKDPFAEPQSSSQVPRNPKNDNINKLMAHRDDTSKMDSLADLIEGDVESKFYTRRGTIEGTDPNEPNFGQTGNYTDKYPDLPSRGFRDAQDPERELSSIKMEGDEDRGSHLGRNSPIHRKSGSTDPAGQNQNHRNSTGPEYNKIPQEKRPLSSAGGQPPKPRAREMSVDQSGERGSNVVPEPRQNTISKIARNDDKYQPAENGANPESHQNKPPSVQVAQAKHPSTNAQNPNKSSMPADLSKTASQLPPKNIKQRVQEPQSARIPVNGKDDKSRGERSLDPMTNFAESPRSNSVRRKDSRGSDIDDRSKPKKPAGPSEFPLINSTLPKYGGEESVDSPEARREKMPPLPKIAQSSGSQPHARPSEQHRLPGAQRSNGVPSGKPTDRDGNPKSASGRSRENSELPIITNPQSQRKPGSGQDRSNPNDVVAESLPNNANPNLRQILKQFGVPGQPLPDSDTMYLDLVMDESLDIELNIEEMEDEEDDPDQPGQGQKRKVEPQYEIIGTLTSSNPEHPPAHSPQSHRGVSRSPSRTSKFGG